MGLETEEKGVAYTYKKEHTSTKRINVQEENEYRMGVEIKKKKKWSSLYKGTQTDRKITKLYTKWEVSN